MMAANHGRPVSLFLKTAQVKLPWSSCLTVGSITIQGYTGQKDHVINADEKLGATMGDYPGKTGELLMSCRMVIRDEHMGAWEG